ncbi:unnamed protein product [Brassica oleracea var. botrytis]
MIWTASGENMITTDGASKMEALYPAAKILVELSISQDSAATDRTRTTINGPSLTVAAKTLRNRIFSRSGSTSAGPSRWATPGHEERPKGYFSATGTIAQMGRLGASLLHHELPHDRHPRRRAQC